MRHFSVKIRQGNKRTNSYHASNNGIQKKHQGQLPLPPELVGPATLTYVLPGLKNSSLLSLGQFMDSGCWALVNKRVLNIYKDKKLILQGVRNWTDGLWDVCLKKNARIPLKLVGKKMNALISTSKTKTQLADYLHACLFSPCPSTLQKAIQNKCLLTWPGIDQINFCKLVPHAIPTSK